MFNPLVTLGVDPGFSSMGIAVIQRNALGQINLMTADVLETKKANKKAMRDLRVAADDQRRMREFWDRLLDCIDSYEPKAVGVESYAPWPGQMGGNAWKVAFSYQMAICACWTKGIRPLSFRPDDLKRRILGKNSGDKRSVELMLYTKIGGLEAFLATMPKTKHEHAADAAGHAYLAMMEVDQMQQMYGDLK